MLLLIKLIKLYIESEIQQVATEEYSNRNTTTNIIYAANPHFEMTTEFKELAILTGNGSDKETEYCGKKPNIQQSRSFSAHCNF